MFESEKILKRTHISVTPAMHAAVKEIAAIEGRHEQQQYRWFVEQGITRWYAERNRTIEAKHRLMSPASATDRRSSTA